MRWWRTRDRRPDEPASGGPTSPGQASDEPRCSCGEPLDPLDLHYGFGLPDEVFAMDPDVRARRLRGSRTLFVQDERTAFVRTLLPVDLDHGTVTIGIWLEVPVEQAEAAMAVWDEPAYLDVRFDGTVANALPLGTGLLGARATAAPRTDDALPYLVGGDDPVESLLRDGRSRAEVLAALPQLAHAHHA